MDIRFLTAPHLLQTLGYIQVANVGTGNLAVSEPRYQLHWSLDQVMC